MYLGGLLEILNDIGYRPSLILACAMLLCLFLYLFP